MSKTQKRIPASSFPQKVSFFINLLSAFIPFIITICLILCTIWIISPKYIFVSTDNNTIKTLHPITIIIDAGHGGKDPGKVGTLETLEKDINLKIALDLKEILESQNMHVIMTREEDKDLSKTSDNFKASDMMERVALIQKSNADLVVSIHQNSYTDPQVYGAQCFYYSNSEEGKTLASIIQQQIINSTNQTKIREIKSNNDYYLLKHSSLPTVIVECGFLSNPNEEQLLLTEEYQRKMAWAIHLGILQYLSQEKNGF